MNVAEICSREVVVMDRGESLHEAVRLMREHHVGDVVITEQRAGRTVPIGILTDRDILIEVVAQDVPLANLAVSDVMSFDLLTVGENHSETDALLSMRRKGVRRAPVVDGEGTLVGIVTVDDVIEVLAEQLGNIAALIGREQAFERQRRVV
ncbi:MAG: CBS domain-containing protein [Gammaproteobacteria bacterium]|jgi:CBS domain-containing protein